MFFKDIVDSVAVDVEGRLAEFGLGEVFVGSVEGEVFKLVTEDFAGVIPDFTGYRMVFVEGFPHTDVLCTLS